MIESTGIVASWLASARTLATQARSTSASARLRLTYSNNTDGRSAFVPRGPRIRRLDRVQVRPRRADLEDRLEHDGQASRLEDGVQKRGVRWHALRFCTVHATPDGAGSSPAAAAKAPVEQGFMTARFAPEPGRSVRLRDAEYLESGRGGTAMRPDPVHVLLVEDEPGHVELARRAFEGRPGEFEVSVAETIAQARAHLRGDYPPQIVVCDWLLPGRRGPGPAAGRGAGGDAPVVIMTSHGSERVAVEAIRAGAIDYVVKSELALADLPHLAERAVRQRRVEQTLHDLVAGTAASGDALYGELVLRLARTLRVKYASAAEIVSPGRVRTLARSVDGRLAPNVEYDLAGTPCESVHRQQRLPHPRRGGPTLPAGRGTSRRWGRAATSASCSAPRRESRSAW